jgi:opacity protein-like surface antigen
MPTFQTHSARPGRTCRNLLVVAAAPVLGLAISAGPSAAEDLGLHASLGVGAGHLDLSPRLESGLAEGGVHLDPDATGGQLRVGYSFNPHFQLDLVLAGLDLDTGDPNVQADYGEARIEVLSYLTTEGQARPYLAGSIGGGVLGVGPDQDDQKEIGASVASFGGGLDVRLSDHWNLGFDYRYGVLDFERKQIDLPLQAVVLDGTAISHTWGARFEFGF